MYSMNRKEEIIPDLKMMERVIERLNNKFDPVDFYHHSNPDADMFEFQFKTDNKRREAWQIVFMGFYTVASGGFLGYDYSDCQEEEYVTLESRNEMKIYMLAVNGAINVINKFIEYVAASDTSVQNKNQWIEMLKKSIEEE